MKHIVFAIGSLYGGGAERVVSVWASALAGRGYKVSVLVYARTENEYHLDPQVEVCPIAASFDECKRLSLLKRLRRFRAKIKSLRPDLIISFLPEMQIYVALASFGLRIPRVETVRISPWETGILKTRFARLWLWCFRSSSAVILQSEAQKAFFKEKAQKKSVVIPNPLNPIYLDNPKTEYNAKSHRVIAAGRLSEQKNYKMAIDAIKQVSKRYGDVSFEIYGVGPLESELKSYIKDLGLENNVFLMGRTGELYKAYGNADVYVMSSDYEGMPNALAEAMAVGLPSISTDCKTGPRDLIDDGESGYLIPCKDSAALAGKIEKIFSMSSDSQRILGEKARKKITDFCSEENSLKRLIFLIESL